MAIRYSSRYGFLFGFSSRGDNFELSLIVDKKNDKISKASLAKIGNDNAETWTEEKAIEVFQKSIELSKEKSDYFVNGKIVQGYEFHFIGEVACHEDVDQYSDVYLYLKDKYKSCQRLYDKLKRRLEQNCFSDSKKGVIKEATAIMNLKSNYKWTDRNDNTSGDKPIKPTTSIIFFNGDSDK